MLISSYFSCLNLRILIAFLLILQTIANLLSFLFFNLIAVTLIRLPCVALFLRTPFDDTTLYIWKVNPELDYFSTSFLKHCQSASRLICCLCVAQMQIFPPSQTNLAFVMTFCIFDNTRQSYPFIISEAFRLSFISCLFGIQSAYFIATQIGMSCKGYRCESNC